MFDDQHFLAGLVLETSKGIAIAASRKVGVRRRMRTGNGCD